MSNTEPHELQAAESLRDSSLAEDEQSHPSQSIMTRLFPKEGQAAVLLGCSILQLPIWGFAMTYGIFQEYYLSHWNFIGSKSTVGVIGMTYNGVMYLSMPILFLALTRRWAKYRQLAAVAGVLISCASFLLCSFAKDVWQLVMAQGILAAIGGALLFTPTTLSLGEHYTSGNRALAYGITLSCKNITGTTCPFLMQIMLDKLSFRRTMWIWAGIVASTSLLAIVCMPMRPSGRSDDQEQRTRKVPWDFLYHKTFYIYGIAIVLQSSGYGIPQTYLNGYAHEVASLSINTSTLLITLFNIPGIISSTFFGWLSDNRFKRLSANASTSFSALASALATFLLWGLAGSAHDSMALLIMYSLIYGFFAGGYSGTWGGIIKEMEAEAAERNEAIDSGMVYGLLNGARGIGFVGGGVAGVQLLKAGNSIARFGYETRYGPLILYTGLATAFGGWSIVFKGKRVGHAMRWARLRA